MDGDSTGTRQIDMWACGQQHQHMARGWQTRRLRFYVSLIVVFDNHFLGLKKRRKKKKEKKNTDENKSAKTKWQKKKDGGNVTGHFENKAGCLTSWSIWGDIYVSRPHYVYHHGRSLVTG